MRLRDLQMRTFIMEKKKKTLKSLSTNAKDIQIIISDNTSF